MGVPNSKRHGSTFTYHGQFLSLEPTHDSQLFNPAHD
jgi:hypothetical protein